MSDGLSIKITVSENAQAILANLRTMPDWVGKRIARSMDLQNQLTVAHIDQVYLSFPKDGPTVPIGCRVQSNRLRGSIRASKAIPSPEGVSSSIGSNVVYAAAQEFGADYPARDIVPKNGKALRFMIGQRVIFAKKVHMPAHTMQGRHFVENGIRDRAQHYSNAFTRAIIAGWNENKTE